MLFAQPMTSSIACALLCDIGRIVRGFEVIQFVTFGISLDVLQVERTVIAERSHNGIGRSPARIPSIISK